MYIICCYDVNSKNCSKYMKLLRRYLFHVQESVFEGELTPAKYKKLCRELEKMATEEDHIILYYSYNTKQILKNEIGKKEDKLKQIIL